MAYYPSLAMAQDSVSARISGVVRDSESQERLAGAVITVDDHPVSHSDSVGGFEISVAPGSSLLVVRRIGYAPAAARLQLQPGSQLELEVNLSRHAVGLDTVVINAEAPRYTPRLSEFWRRRGTWPTGRFLTYEDIAALPVSRLSDVFRTLRGINIKCIDAYCSAYKLEVSGARVLPSFTPHADGACEVQYYLDGAAYYLSAGGIDGIAPPEWIAGIEVYLSSSQTPMEYSGRDARCGVVVIWTKDGSEGRE